MDLLDETGLFENIPDPKQLLNGFNNICEKRFLLLKRGKIFKHRVFRYVRFKSNTLHYFLSEHSPSKKGSIKLHKCIAIPIKSPLFQHPYCIKIMAYSSSSFQIFCENSEEQEIMLQYIKLASNNTLQSILDKMCFSALDQEFQIINELKTPKNSKKNENFLTPKNALSRFLFSPVSECNFDAPEEDIIVRLPLSAHNELGQVKEEDLEATLVEIKELQTDPLRFFEGPSTAENLLLEMGTIEEVRELGVKYLWNYQLTYAKKAFESIRGKDLRSNLHCAELCLFRVLITGRKSDIKNSMDEIENFQKVYQVLQDPNSEILNAESTLYKSIILIITGQKFKAFINLRNCWKAYKKFEGSSLDRDMRSRVELGLGLFLLLISLAPTSVSTILRLAGFSSNREEGLFHLQKGYELEGSHSVYSGIILSLYYTDLDPDIEKALKIIENLVKQYPGCVLLHWVKSIISWKQNQIEAAIGYLNLALRCCEPDLSQQAAFIKYELGWFYFLRFDWVLAKSQFESILLDTLSLSSDLDELVKNLLLHGKLSPSQTLLFQSMANNKKGKKKKTQNWLESEKTPDRVYLPHKSCLISQLVSCISALTCYDETWLKMIQISSNGSNSHSNLDLDFGGLSQSYINRKSTVLMPYEVIYFMKQHTKLLPHMLVKIFTTASNVVSRIAENIKENIAEFCSARMLQIMALALNGDTVQAAELGKTVLDWIDLLPVWANYLAPHTLYWCSRIFIIENNKKLAAILLKKAKKYKKYIFDISPKIERVNAELM